MRIAGYPYGKVTKTLRKAVTWLNRNKIKLVRENGEVDEFLYTEFDYPDYYGMPKTISCRLNSDEVDWLQSEVLKWRRLKRALRYSKKYSCK